MITSRNRLAVAYPRDLAQEDQHFNSGINDKGEVRGLLMSGRHVGITASNMRPGMLRELAVCRHTLTRLFVDSGAFSEIKFGPYRVVKEITDAQWCRRFKLYRWAAATFRDRAYLVAPDRVGDQEVTLARLTLYAIDMARCAAHGAYIIVPVQKGAMPMAAFFAHAVRTLEFFGVNPAQIIAGIPMQKDATSIDDLRAFCDTLVWFVPRVHLLGIGPKAKQGRFWKAVAAIKASRPNAEITSDSALVPSLVNRGGKKAKASGKDQRRILTRLQDDARAQGIKGSDVKAYGLTKQGHIEIDRDRVRAEDAGWYDEELYDSVEEARAHRLAGYPDDAVRIEHARASTDRDADEVETTPALRQTTELQLTLKLSHRDATITTYEILL